MASQREHVTQQTISDDGATFRIGNPITVSTKKIDENWCVEQSVKRCIAVRKTLCNISRGSPQCIDVRQYTRCRIISDSCPSWEVNNLNSEQSDNQTSISTYSRAITSVQELWL